MRVVPLLPFIQDLREIKNISCIQWSITMNITQNCTSAKKFVDACMFVGLNYR